MHPTTITTPKSFLNASQSSQSTPAIITISNIVASVQLGTKGELDLSFLARTCRNVEYSPKKMTCAFLKIPKLNLTGFIFRNGRILISGLHDEVTARLATRYIARYLQTVGGYPNLVYHNFQILTISCSFDARFPIDLDQFISTVGAPKAKTHGSQVTLVDYTHSGDVTMMISASGKVVIKTTSREVAVQALKSVYPILVKCRASAGMGGRVGIR